jgi:hypothetical protein
MPSLEMSLETTAQLVTFRPPRLDVCLRWKGVVGMWATTEWGQVAHGRPRLGSSTSGGQAERFSPIFWGLRILLVAHASWGLSYPQ